MMLAQLQAVRARIANAARRAGRLPEAIRLIGVTKGVGVALIREALAAGVTDLGENRVQEAAPKIMAIGPPEGDRPAVRWHLIGHLQRNKVKRAVQLFDGVQSLDDLALAQALDRQAAVAEPPREAGLPLDHSLGMRGGSPGECEGAGLPLLGSGGAAQGSRAPSDARKSEGISPSGSQAGGRPGGHQWVAEGRRPSRSQEDRWEGTWVPSQARGVRRATAMGRRVPVLVEVNLSGEATKHGVPPAGVEPLVAAVRLMQHLEVRGLMTMAPWVAEPEQARPYFRRLRELAGQVGVSELSMGMSQDFEVAVEEGATMVRIGRAIFHELGGDR